MHLAARSTEAIHPALLRTARARTPSLWPPVGCLLSLTVMALGRSESTWQSGHWDRAEPVNVRFNDVRSPEGEIVSVITEVRVAELNTQLFEFSLDFSKLPETLEAVTSMLLGHLSHEICLSHFFKIVHKPLAGCINRPKSAHPD